MDTSLSKTIIDDTKKNFSSNTKEIVYPNDNLLPLSINTALANSYADVLPKEEKVGEICSPSDTLVSHQNGSIPNDNRKFRIHLGTQPGFYREGQITFSHSENLHAAVIDVLGKFLDTANIDYELVKKDAFSRSAWGLEPYACVLLTCSMELAKGLAAIIGLSLRQDAIGIFAGDNDGFSHPVFTLSTCDGSLIEKADALILMKVITKHCSALASQFDEYGQNIELHDFENTNDTTVSIKRIQTIINRYFGMNNEFRITKDIGHSELLESDNYENAIKQAGLDLPSKLIALTRLHDDLYGKTPTNA